MSFFVAYDGPPRNKDQTAATTGSMVGETKKDGKLETILYTLINQIRNKYILFN